MGAVYLALLLLAELADQPVRATSASAVTCRDSSQCAGQYEQCCRWDNSAGENSGDGACAEICTLGIVEAKDSCSSTVCAESICTDGLPLRKSGSDCCACPATCPDHAPFSGDSCEQEGLECNYDPYVGCDGKQLYTKFATCDGGMWMMAVTDRMECSSTIHPTTDCSLEVCQEAMCDDGMARRQIGDDCCACQSGTGLDWIGQELPEGHTATCPDAKPSPFEECHAQEGMYCKYSPVECPDGSVVYTSFAECQGGLWYMSSAQLVCPTTTQSVPQVPVPQACPAELPMPKDKCMQEGMKCDYSPIECPGGTLHYATLAECERDGWILFATKCPEATTPVPDAKAPSCGGDTGMCCPEMYYTCKKPSAGEAEKCVGSGGAIAQPVACKADVTTTTPGGTTHGGSGFLESADHGMFGQATTTPSESQLLMEAYGVIPAHASPSTLPGGIFSWLGLVAAAFFGSSALQL